MVLLTSQCRRTWLCVLTTLVLLLGCIPHREVQAEPEMTNQTISDKISDEMLLDPGVVSTRLDIQTEDGIVTLSGQVNNILAKERAVRIAETVKGVRAVVNRIEVKPSPLRTDDAIKKDIKTALRTDPATEAREIDVRVNEGAVKLTGKVESYQELDLVRKVAQGVRGVVDLQEEIHVFYKDERPDQEIEEEVQETLRWDSQINDHMITVTVDQGQVKLAGVVGSAAEVRMAKADAWVAGVDDVDTEHLEVDPWIREEKLRGDKFVSKTEEEISSAVQDALLRDPRVKFFNVDVEVTGRTVTLRGTVDNLKARRAAARDAKNTVGVSYVENRLKTRFNQNREDTAIAADVRDAFYRDPYIERFDITVTVLNDTAYLYGKVDSQYEKDRADDLASRVPGVVDVRNFLSVAEQRPYVSDPYIDDLFIDQDALVRYDRRSPYQSDKEIKNDIQDELWWSPFVSSEKIKVSVDDGIATLKGQVSSWSERRASTENAYEGGALLVDNELVVKSD